MRIALICQYFAPEPGAPQARLLETARVWSAAGHDVTVLTAFPNHPNGILAPGDRGRLLRVEAMEGIRVVRSFVYATPNRGIVKKTLGHLSFMVSSGLAAPFAVRRPDVIVVSSPTFFSVLTARFLSAVWCRPFVFEVRDLWPAIFTELGVVRSERVVRALTAVEMYLYRRAGRVVTVTDGFRENIVSRGIAPEKVVTITNGVDTRRFRPETDGEERKRELGLAGRFVVLYLGAHGISHALGRILDVAGRLREDGRICFVFVGDGAEKPALVARARREGVENVRFLPPVPKSEVSSYYAAADLCLVPLRDVPLFHTFIPSKMFEILGCGRPIVASLAGEAADILSRSGGAEVVGPEDVDGIARAIRRLVGDPGERARMGRRGVEFVRKFYDRRDLAVLYLEVLGELVEESRR